MIFITERRGVLFDFDSNLIELCEIMKLFWTFNSKQLFLKVLYMTMITSPLVIWTVFL